MAESKSLSMTLLLHKALIITTKQDEALKMFTVIVQEAFFNLPEGFQSQPVNKASVRSEGLMKTYTEVGKTIFERLFPVIFKQLVFFEGRKCSQNENFVVRELHGVL